MNQHELKKLRRKARNLTIEVETINRQVRTRLAVVQAQRACFESVSIQHELAMTALNVEIMNEQTSQAEPSSEFSKNFHRDLVAELLAEQTRLEACKQQQSDELEKVKVEQAKLLARFYDLVQRLNDLNCELMQSELMNIVHQ